MILRGQFRDGHLLTIDTDGIDLPQPERDALGDFLRDTDREWVVGRDGKGQLCALPSMDLLGVWVVAGTEARVP